jgi:hypothetical protein
MKEFNRIRNEIRLRKLDLISKGENANNALNIARKEANDKYGKGWREDLLIKASGGVKVKEPTIYDEHINGEHWME